MNWGGPVSDPVDERSARLWIWSPDSEDHPLTGIRDGLVAIKAPTETMAWELLKQKDILYWWWLQNRPTLPISTKQPNDIKELKKWIEAEIAPYVDKPSKGAYRPEYLRDYKAIIIRPIFGEICTL